MSNMLHAYLHAVCESEHRNSCRKVYDGEVLMLLAIKHRKEHLGQGVGGAQHVYHVQKCGFPLLLHWTLVAAACQCCKAL